MRWYRFPRPDKRRPVLLLTRDSIIEYLCEVTVAPISTTIRDIPSEVLLGPVDGMPRACAVNCDHLQTIDKSRLGSCLIMLDHETMNQVQEAVHFALGWVSD